MHLIINDWLEPPSVWQFHAQSVTSAISLKMLHEQETTMFIS